MTKKFNRLLSRVLVGVLCIVALSLSFGGVLASDSSVISPIKGDTSSLLVTPGTIGPGYTVFSDGSWQTRLSEDRLVYPRQLAPFADYLNQSSWFHWAGTSLDGTISRSLSQELAFRYGVTFNTDEYNTAAADCLPYGVKKGSSLLTIMGSPPVDSELKSLMKLVFPYEDPITKKPEFTGEESYAKDVALGLAFNLFDTKNIGGKLYFSANDTVSRLEFLHMLLSVNIWADIDVKKQLSRIPSKSLDGVLSSKDKYFLDYTQYVTWRGCALYRLYTKSELYAPVTNMEAAYLVAQVWGHLPDSISKKLNWDKPYLYKSVFKDLKYKLQYRYYTDTVESSTGRITRTKKCVSHYLNDYKGKGTVDQLIKNVVSKKSAMPIPLYMSLVELNKQGVLTPSNKMSNASKNLTRLEALKMVIASGVKEPDIFSDPYDRGW